MESTRACAAASPALRSSASAARVTSANHSAWRRASSPARPAEARRWRANARDGIEKIEAGRRASAIDVTSDRRVRMRTTSTTPGCSSTPSMSVATTGPAKVERAARMPASVSSRRASDQARTSFRLRWAQRRGGGLSEACRAVHRACRRVLRRSWCRTGRVVATRRCGAWIALWAVRHPPISPRRARLAQPRRHERPGGQRAACAGWCCRWGRRDLRRRPARLPRYDPR